ncbi:SDR family oxidoreductase [Coleofasciculus sp.]|uniref:SDR family oxidoreductase n=1 Tax=Coleofasciculus sp. TaxID=3100458 RepID=UPI003A22828D
MKRSVFISGASSGIGRACAIYLSEMGYQVFAGVRKQDDAEKLKYESGNEIIPIFLDLTDENSIREAAKTTQHLSESCPLVGAINNAGIVVVGPLECIPISEFRQQFEVNVIGQLSLTQAFLPLLRRTQGRIVNIGSDYGRVASPILGPYCASKFALKALTDSLRMEVKAWEISVSIVEIGTINTPIWDKSIRSNEKIWDNFTDESKKLYSFMLQAVKDKAGELGKNGLPPESVAKVVAKILEARKPKARYIVGLDSRLNILMSKFVPDSILDRLIMLYLGL